MRFTRSLASALGALCIVPAVAFSQTYPVKPVRVIVPWPPGGSNDIVGRIVAQKMSEHARASSSSSRTAAALPGMIGSDLVAKARPTATPSWCSRRRMSPTRISIKKLPYDTVKDFMGITPLALQVGMIVVHPSLPVKTVKEFIALSKTRPNQIAYASSGNGSFVHLAMALFNSMTDTKMVHVPYKGGGPAAIALAAGETQAMCATVGSVIPHIEGKRLRPLGFTSDRRMRAVSGHSRRLRETVKGYEFTALDRRVRAGRDAEADRRPPERGAEAGACRARRGEDTGQPDARASAHGAGAVRPTAELRLRQIREGDQAVRGADRLSRAGRGRLPSSPLSGLI